MAPQSIIWDTAKARANWKKHGIQFEEAATVFLDPLLLVLPDLRHSHEEERYIALGRTAHQLLLVVVHTDDDQTIRIISARKAEPREKRQYEQNV